MLTAGYPGPDRKRAACFDVLPVREREVRFQLSLSACFISPLTSPHESAHSGYQQPFLEEKLGNCV